MRYTYGNLRHYLLCIFAGLCYYINLIAVDIYQQQNNPHQRPKCKLPVGQKLLNYYLVGEDDNYGGLVENGKVR